MITDWRYRIVKKEGKYGLFPVFIDDNGDIVNINNIPVYISESMIDLPTLENKAGIPIPSLMREAFDYPVLDYNTGEEIQDRN